MIAFAEEPIGGEPIGKEGNFVEKISLHPHMGDRQDRLGLTQRDTGLQYNWLPDTCVVDVFEINASTNLRQVSLGFTYNKEARLTNLNIDDNEALEAEVLFYNYGPNEKIPSTGRAYIYTQEYWNHNIPAEAYPYVDTRFCDENKWTGIIEEVSYCIGIANTNALEQGTKYWWLFQGMPQKYIETPYGNFPIEVPDEGLAKVQFTRSYNFINPALNAIHESNGHDQWSVFNEEYEKIITSIDFKQYKVPKRLEFTINDDELYIKRKTLNGAD
jgi:hypothetical protein